MKKYTAKYLRQTICSSVIKTIAAAVVVVNLSACGGSSGASLSTSSTSSSFTSSVDSVSISSVSSSSVLSSSSAATKMRLAQLKYDLDNNGVFDLVRDYRYNPDGSLSDTSDVYQDDGVSDPEFIYLATGLTKDHIDGRTERYFYNNDGYVSSWVNNSTNGRDEYIYEYAEDGVVNYYRNDTYDLSGARLNRFEFTANQFTYNSKRQIVAVLQLLNIGWILTYNDRGLIEASDLHFGPFTLTSTYLWHSDGQIASIENDDGNYQNQFHYDMSGRFESMVTVDSNNPAHNVTQSMVYDSAGKPAHRYYDQGSDGTQEALTEYVWEEGVCSERQVWILWAQPNEMRVAQADDRFLAGTGYSQLGNCREL